MMLQLLISVALAAGQVPPGRLPPIDTCRDDAGFIAFRKRLETAVARRDVAALLQLMDDKVRLTFGGRAGKEGFRQLWLARPDEQSKLWAELDEVLELGCARAKDAHGADYRAFPSMFVTGDGLDGYGTWVARPGARLRRAPSLRGRVIARLNWHVLHVDGEWRGGEWIPVRVRGGPRGYVHRSVARSLIDYRLIAQQRGGRWLITAFIAGD
jgi:hypothetical protein